MPWPKIETVAAAFGFRVAEVIQTPEGPARGLRCGNPEVYVVVTPKKSYGFCGVCGAREDVPPPPSSRGLNGAPEALFTPGTRAHALHALTWMHRWETAHTHEQEAASGGTLGQGEV